MTSKPVSNEDFKALKLRVAELEKKDKTKNRTNDEQLALCKLVQIVSHSSEYPEISMAVWNEYLHTSLGFTVLYAQEVTEALRKAAIRELRNASASD